MQRKWAVRRKWQYYIPPYLRKMSYRTNWRIKTPSCHYDDRSVIFHYTVTKSHKELVYIDTKSHRWLLQCIIVVFGLPILALGVFDLRNGNTKIGGFRNAYFWFQALRMAKSEHVTLWFKIASLEVIKYLELTRQLSF